MLTSLASQLRDLVCHCDFLKAEAKVISMHPWYKYIRFSHFGKKNMSRTGFRIKCTPVKKCHVWPLCRKLAVHLRETDVASFLLDMMTHLSNRGIKWRP